MIKPLVYSHGLPFDKTLAANLDDMRARIENGKAVLLVLDGGVGEGKTTLAVHCADYLNGAYVEENRFIDFRRQYSMGGAQFQERLQMCVDSKLPVIIYDEAGDFNKRGSLTQFNLQLNRIFETYRTFKIIVIIVLPSAGVLDRDLFLKGISRMGIHCENRQKNYGRYRGYSLWKMMFVLDKMKKLIVPQQAYKRTSPNFYGQFLDLPFERARELQAICDEGKRDILSANTLKNKGLVSLNDLAKNLNITKQYANYIIRSLKLKETSIFKRIRYFDSDAVARISAKVGDKK